MKASTVRADRLYNKQDPVHLKSLFYKVNDDWLLLLRFDWFRQIAAEGVIVGKWVTLIWATAGLFMSQNFSW